MQDKTRILLIGKNGQVGWELQSALAPLGNVTALGHVTAADYPSPSQRPLYSVLSSDKLKQRFGISFVSWEAQLELCWRNKLECQF